MTRKGSETELTITTSTTTHTTDEDPETLTPRVRFLRATSRTQFRLQCDRYNANASMDYLRRRYEVALFEPPEPINLQNDPNSIDMPPPPTKHLIERQSVSCLPIATQLRVRRRLWSILMLQVLFVWVLVGMLSFVSRSRLLFDRYFASHLWHVLYTLGAVVLCLIALYVCRTVCCLNWCLLWVFSISQAVFFTSAGVCFQTPIGFFNCGFTFICILIMIGLSGIGSRDPLTQEERLLSPYYAGGIAFAITGTLFAILYFGAGDQLGITQHACLMTLGFQLGLLMWLCWDAMQLYRVMAPSEARLGVIYLYTDFILVFVLVLAIVGLCAVANNANISADDVVEQASEECISCCVEYDEEAGAAGMLATRAIR